MSEILTVSINSWVKDAVVKMAKEKKIGVSETVNELLTKALLGFKVKK